jgi:hypothetical protein
MLALLFLWSYDRVDSSRCPDSRVCSTDVTPRTTGTCGLQIAVRFPLGFLDSSVGNTVFILNDKSVEDEIGRNSSVSPFGPIVNTCSSNSRSQSVELIVLRATADLFMVPINCPGDDIPATDKLKLRAPWYYAVS